MTPRAGSKVPVTERAMIQRINRALAEDDLRLKVARGARAMQDCGRLYVVNVKINGVVQHDVNLEDLARKLRTIEAFEELVTETG